MLYPPELGGTGNKKRLVLLLNTKKKSLNQLLCLCIPVTMGSLEEYIDTRTRIFSCLPILTRLSNDRK